MLLKRTFYSASITSTRAFEIKRQITNLMLIWSYLLRPLSNLGSLVYSSSFGALSAIFAAAAAVAFEAKKGE